ncbi:ABC transporter permease [Variovorax rhizosphaerae]|uniref:ABC transporter permease n=1 Tax=Variovorax rhizosphaerae TaxID=1836200 RepID=A0ABU8WTA2_9BURK
MSSEFYLRMARKFAVLLAYFLMLAPVATVIAISFFNQEMVSFPPNGFTLTWYENAWAKKEFANGFLTSLRIALLATIIGVPLGTAAALGLNRSDIKGKGALNTLLLSPLAVPGVVLGTALYMFFVRLENVVNGEIIATTSSLVVAHVMLTIPWTIRLVGASLINFDRSAEEAATNLGASSFTVFRRVTLPLLKPSLVAASVFSFIASFENLELSLLLVGPGVTTLPVAMMSYLEFRVDPTVSAVATVQILLVALMLFITDRFVKLTKVI